MFPVSATSSGRKDTAGRGRDDAGYYPATPYGSAIIPRTGEKSRPFEPFMPPTAADENTSPPAPRPAPGEAAAFAQRVLRAEADAVLNVIPRIGPAFDRAVDALASCSGNVIVSGMGKSGLIAQKISATLASTGTPSHFIHPTEAMHGDLGRIRAADLALLLSYTGNTEEVLALAALLRQDRIPIVANLATAESHLGRLADTALEVGDVAEACPHNLAPTASTTAMLALGDALALAVSARRSFSRDDFRKRHPGGLLGRRMLPVTGILRFRAGENLPLVRATGTVRSVLEQSPHSRRSGALLLVDHEGRLAGILTDAEVRRLLVKHGPAALDLPIESAMTRSPKHLTSDAVVADAVQMIRELRVDELPVVDPEGRPLGLVDVQDLIALKVIEE